ncbi:glyoxalase/bleomycin resistance/extradiol dioxygenase family protein [Saccharopolyspora sp. K220]|uniref:VOC family protein n=1 Tax=Saccharopolyspora soli TaxID=2926618 RepID=UPI001F59FEB0|nr:VOC family protein [Saccharopolyspora soli]MCI2422738.1 glyoxalase/bleomycin resistance/extradiol dioxygenase family protein [Saccharopolyspora soli]
MSIKTFVNLPVKDLGKSIEFFTALGFSFNQQFTDENATCMVISDEAYAMLLVEPFFKQFTKKELVDATKATEVVVALGVESRAQVDEMAEKAFAAGAQPANEPMDEGPMYTKSFQDLDGHIWELVHMSLDD